MLDLYGVSVRGLHLVCRHYDEQNLSLAVFVFLKRCFAAGSCTR